MNELPWRMSKQALFWLSTTQNPLFSTQASHQQVNIPRDLADLPLYRLKETDLVRRVCKQQDDASRRVIQ